MILHTDLTAVPHASLSKPPKVPGRKLESEASKTYKTKTSGGDRVTTDRAGLRSSKAQRSKENHHCIFTEGSNEVDSLCST